MRAVVAEAAARNITIHRISQGSGIMLQTDDEIREMLALGREHDIEVCLFVGPRANWDTGVQAAASARTRASARRCAAPISSATASTTCCTAPRSALRSILVGRPRAPADSRRDEEARRSAAGFRAEDLCHPCGRESGDGAAARRSRRDVDQSAGRSCRCRRSPRFVRRSTPRSISTSRVRTTSAGPCATMRRRARPRRPRRSI